MADSFVHVVDISSAYVSDPDLDGTIERVTIVLTNPQLSSDLEYLTIDESISLSSTVTPHEIVIYGVNTPQVYSGALLSVKYYNEADEPLAIPRIILFTIFDGKNTNFPLTQTTITVLVSNDAPEVYPSGIIGKHDHTFQFQEGAEPEDVPAMIPDLIVQDSDHTQLASADIRLFQVFDVGNESISINTTLIIGSGITCTPIDCSGQSLQLNGSANVSVYQSVLRSLKYINTKKPSDFPSLFDRFVNLTVSDGERDSSPDVVIVIDIVPTNPRVIIDLDTPNHNFFINYTEGSSLLAPIAGATRWIDISLTTLLRMLIKIRDPVLEAGEELVVDNNCVFALNISTNINNALKEITFGLGTMDSFLSVINCVTYRNTEPEPRPIVRYVDFTFIPGGGAPNDTAETVIYIIHINDNAPTCNTPSVVEVPENTLTGIPIHTVLAEDVDRGSGDIISYILITSWPDIFTLTTGVNGASVSLLQQVDYDEGIREYPIIIEACDNGSPMRCCNFSFVFNVTDFNDNPPDFVNDPYVVTVNENANTTLINFNITDLDSGINAQLSNLIIDSVHPQGGCVNIFQTTVSPPSLQIVNGGMDYETQPTCYVYITAVDAGNPMLQTSTNVTVQAIDQDDKDPELLEPKVFEVTENNTVPYVLGTLKATDPDTDDSLLGFSLPDADPAVFSVTSDGVFSILIVTNRTISTVYIINVKVTDPAGNSIIDQVTVNVVPINNDPPSLQLNSVPVVFVEESGVSVTISSNPVITDPDEVTLTISRISAVIANGEDSSLETLSVASDAPNHITTSTDNPFELIIIPENQTNLNDVVSLIQSIQYLNEEDEPSLCRNDLYPCNSPNSRTIRISVFDTKFFSNEEDAIVIFQFVNDAPEIDLDTTSPQTRQLTFTEADPPSLIVNGANYLVKDDDNSSLSSLSCSLLNPLDGAQEMMLVIGSVPNSLTIENNATHTVSLVGIGSVSDYMTGLGLIYYYSSSSDPTVSGDRIINCSASDGLTTGVPVSAIVSFQKRNNLPVISWGLNTVSYTEQSVPVLLSSNPTITDADDDTLRSLRATIIDSNITGHQLSLNSSLLPAGVTFTYECQGSECSLSVQGSASISEYVSLLETIEYSNSLVEFPSLGSFDVELFATDASGNSSIPAVVTISLVEVDDNPPVFTSDLYMFSISESILPPDEAARVIVTDNDRPIPQTPIFSITGGDIGNKFTIINNPSSLLEGIIQVNSPLDFDIKSFYFLTVQASSGNFSEITTLVNITLINENNKDIVFVNFPANFSVYESNVAESLIPSSVQAFDPDNFPITYSVDSPYVTISNSGHLSLSSPVDREGIPGTQFSITITASDGVSSVSKNATVYVLDVNEFPPVFDQVAYLANITENDLPAGDIITIRATDGDETPDLTIPGFVTRLTYSLSPSTYSSYFSLNANTGNLRLITPLDYETTGNSFQLQVIANDNFAPERTTSVPITITVRNVNDELPFFVDFVKEMSVKEDPFTPEFFNITGDDPDPDSNLNFTLESSIGSVPFQIDPSSGHITRTSSLDIDPAGSIHVYPLTVTLTDLNTDSGYLDRSSVNATMTITVNDINDKTPRFNQSSYTVELYENVNVSLPEGFPILTVHADDDDYGFFINGTSNGNNEVTYRLSGEPSDIFVIDSQTGLLRKIKSLNREKRSTYKFYVIASDNPVEDLPNFAMTTITITVLDINEHPPVADPSHYFSTIPEDAAINSTVETKVSIYWSKEGKKMVMLLWL